MRHEGLVRRYYQHAWFKTYNFQNYTVCFLKLWNICRTSPIDNFTLGLVFRRRPFADKTLIHLPNSGYNEQEVSGLRNEVQGLHIRQNELEQYYRHMQREQNHTFRRHDSLMEAINNLRLTQEKQHRGQSHFNRNINDHFEISDKLHVQHSLHGIEQARHSRKNAIFNLKKKKMLETQDLIFFLVL